MIASIVHKIPWICPAVLKNIIQIYKDHLLQTYQSPKLVQELRPVDLQQLRAKRVTIPRRKVYEYKKIVIFDLDETLVHCCYDSCAESTVVLPIVFPNGDIVQAPISIQPYALEYLKKACKKYEVIVFTASHQCYADAALDYLDPEREIIHHRFYRQTAYSWTACISKISEFLQIGELKI